MWGHLLNGNSLLCSCVFVKTNFVLFRRFQLIQDRNVLKQSQPRSFTSMMRHWGWGLTCQPTLILRWKGGSFSVGGAVPRDGSDQGADLEVAGREVEAQPQRDLTSSRSV